MGMNKREFKNRCDVVTRLLSVSINYLSNQTQVNNYFKNAVQFQSLSLGSYNPVFWYLTLITHILLFLKSFRYCINVIKYIRVIYTTLEIFSCDFLERHC